jgi:hypothetical protein
MDREDDPPARPATRDNTPVVAPEWEVQEDEAAFLLDFAAFAAEEEPSDKAGPSSPPPDPVPEEAPAETPAAEEEEEGEWVSLAHLLLTPPFCRVPAPQRTRRLLLGGLCIMVWGRRKRRRKSVCMRERGGGGGRER